MSQPSSSRGNEPGGVLQAYVTAFLDLLGWSSLLRELDAVPDFAADAARVNAVIQKPILDLDRTRLAVEGILLGRVADPEEVNARAALLPPETRKLFLESHDLRYILQGLGDCFIVSTPYEGSASKGMSAIKGLVAQVGFTMLLMLAQGVPIRGAIEIGMGTEYRPHGGGDRQLIGSSIAKAYGLEQKEADFPRILVGPELHKLIVDQSLTPPESEDKRIAGGLADLVLRMLHAEDDGSVSVDYLCPDVKDLLGAEADSECQKAFNFICAQVKKFTEEKNEKLGGKYRQTYAYFTQHGFGPHGNA